MKNILLAVVGMNPQVITETLFALHQQGRKIDAVHVITTREGKDAINARLLAAGSGHYYKYLSEYRIEGITFGTDHIHVITDANGIELDDIAGEEDNEHLLRKCLEITFHFTKNSGTSVFFSIAGGRKTMSACLMVAAQLYGRSQDRVYHVLVSPEYESSRDFFYPPKKSVTIELKGNNGQPYFKETRYATINLVPLPFVSIRERLSDDLLSEPRDPATLMNSLVKDDPQLLVIDMPQRKVLYKGKMELDMNPSHLALYAFFALRKRDCVKETVSCRACSECYLDVEGILTKQQQISELYKKITLSRDHAAMSDTGILGLTKANFNSYKSKIRETLKKGFGLYALADIAIDGVGVKPDTRYGIKIDREMIRLVY